MSAPTSGARKTSAEKLLPMATVVMPASRAAMMPIGASSNATQSAGAAPSRPAAARNTSGNGLPRGTWSLRTIDVRRDARPSSASVWLTFSGGADVATATGIARADRQSSSLTRPFAGTRCPADSWR
jgi:hypothetical protein